MRLLPSVMSSNLTEQTSEPVHSGENLGVSIYFPQMEISVIGHVSLRISSARSARVWRIT